MLSFSLFYYLYIDFFLQFAHFVVWLFVLRFNFFATLLQENFPKGTIKGMMTCNNEFKYIYF